MTFSTTLPSQRLPLDVELASIRDEFSHQKRARRELLKRLAAAWTAYQNTRSQSETDFLRICVPDFETRKPDGTVTINGRYFDWLYGGHALNEGRDAGSIYDLALMGRANLKHGMTWPEIDALLAIGGLSALASHLSKRGATATTTRRLPDTAALALDGVTARLRTMPGAARDDVMLRAQAVEVLERLPDPLLAALLNADEHADALDVMRAALKPEGFLSWAKRERGCTVCQARQNVHAHHVPLDGMTARGNDVLVLTCDAHHIPRPGGTTDVAHSHDWVARHFGSVDGLLIHLNTLWRDYEAHIRGSVTEEDA